MNKYADGTFVAIDPGKHACAYAHFYDCVLDWVDYKPPYVWQSLPHNIVVELPQQRGQRSQIKMSDLIDLARVAGQAGGPRAEFVKVSTWKGSQDKDAMHARARKVLVPLERERLETMIVAVKPSLRHNVMDAVCLGLVMLERM